MATVNMALELKRKQVYAVALHPGTTEEVVECVPQDGYEEGSGVNLEKMDTNKDGVISVDEAIDFGEKACIPDEMVMQLFSEADLNQDKVISSDEFKDAGEDTKTEEAMDEALEDASEGDDESNTVEAPPITEFDKNNDGALDKEEATDAFEHELEKRTEHESIPEDKMKEIKPKIDEAIDEIDTNDDGVIDGEEYVAEAKNEEQSEETLNPFDEDKSELDDLPRAGEEKPAEATGLISKRSMLRRGHRGHGAKATRQQYKLG